MAADQLTVDPATVARLRPNSRHAFERRHQPPRIAPRPPAAPPYRAPTAAYVAEALAAVAAVTAQVEALRSRRLAAPPVAPVAPSVAPIAAPAPIPAPTSGHFSPWQGDKCPEVAARPRSRYDIWATAGAFIRNAGLLMVLFVAFQLWGTDLSQAHSQRSLRNSFATKVAGTPAVPGTQFGPPPAGEAVAMIKIPRLGLEQAVVEGTAVGDLRKGPGHYRGSALPGQHGNVAIAGHRTTYGAPFNRLDELVPGDAILLTTAQGNFAYEVFGQQIVKPSQRAVVNDFHDDRLTLTTCHPKFSARQRYIVFARPADPAKYAKQAAPAPTQRVSAVADTTAGWNPSALLPTALWGLVLAGVWVLTEVWGRRWLRRPAWALAAPLVLLALVGFYGALNQLLPAAA
jgi:sortase A